MIAAILSGLFLGYSFAGLVAHVRANALPRSLFADHNRLHDGHRVRHALRGHRCNIGIGAREHGARVSVLRNSNRLARRRADRVGHVLERVIRWITAHHRRTAWHKSGPNGGGEQLRRGDGQDDRRTIHSRRVDRNQVVRPRRINSAFRFFPLCRPRNASSDFWSWVRLMSGLSPYLPTEDATTE